MRFKIDENLPVEMADRLRASGHDAATIPEQYMSGQPDDRATEVCRKEDRALVTLDMDFSDIRSYPLGQDPGRIVFRLVRQDKPWVLAALDRIIPLLNLEPLAGRLWIVDEQDVRIRGAG
jgi:predicted nuclease of predicted toxin-antitoxin system